MDGILYTRTPSRVSRFILGTFGTTKVRKTALLAGTGISLKNAADLPPTISVLEQRTIIENMAALDGEDWPLKNINKFSPSTIGVVGTAIVANSTVGDGLNLMSQFSHMAATTLYLDQFLMEKHRHLAIGFVLTRGRYGRMVSEVSCAFIFKLLEDMMGPNVHKIELWCSYAKPAHSASYKTAFKCTVKFNMPYTAFVIPNELCALPSLKADEKAYTEANREFIRFRGGVEKPEDETIEAVKRFIKVYSGKRPTSENAADALRMSRRSLARKLRDSGTSFRALLDQSLKERAAILEGRKIYSRDEIAEQLGYSDVTSYGRASRRWRNQ